MLVDYAYIYSLDSSSLDFSSPAMFGIQSIKTCVSSCSSLHFSLFVNYFCFAQEYVLLVIKVCDYIGVIHIKPAALYVQCQYFYKDDKSTLLLLQKYFVYYIGIINDVKTLY